MTPPETLDIFCNGKPQALQGPTTITGLLELLGYTSGSVAVAVNLTFVPRAEYATRTLTSGDEVEIVAPMQGG